MSGVDVHVFRESVARVVRALTDSSITVRQMGSKAFVEYDTAGRPHSVTLPSIPDNASADLLNAIQGFLDHEVSHVLHTDFKHGADMTKKCKANNDKVRPALWNVVEDVFVESAMTKRFTGSMVNIDNIQRFLTGKMLKEGYDKLKADGADAAKIRSFLMPSAVRAAAGQPAFVDYMSDKWHEMGHMEKGIRDLGPAIAKVKSTKEAWGAVDQLYTVVAQPPTPGGSPEGKGDGGGSGSESDDDGDESGGSSAPGDGSGSKGKPSKSKPKPKPKPKSEKDSDDEGDGDGEGDGESESDGDGDSEKDEKDEKKGKSGKGDSDDSEEEEEDEETEGSSGSGDEEDDESHDGSTADDESEPSSPAEQAGRRDEEGSPNGGKVSAEESPTDIEDLIDPSMIRPLDDIASELIEKEIAEHLRLNPSDYVPYSRDNDYVGPLPAAEEFQKLSLDTSSVAKLASETSHVIQGEVERLFRARAATRWNPGQRKGKVNRGGLHKTCIGDDRVFRTKIETDTRQVAVELVIDCSGSMYGQKIEYATVAAYMLASVLDKIGVPCEIVGFTTMNGPVSGHLSTGDWRDFMNKAHDAENRGSGKFARFAPTCLYVFKDFAKRFDDRVKKTLGFLSTATGFMSNNVDGESIETCALRLMQRKEPRKVMIVMSDGQPACDGDRNRQQRKLKQVIEDVAKSGIEVYGLGLMDDAVQSYYQKCEVIHKVTEIPQKVLALVQKLLVS